MAERIKGLSIALDMETSGLDRSLSEIRRSFRALNTSIKTNSNNLKFGEQSIESYEKNVEALNDDIEKQRKNLEDLKKKHEDAVREQGENSKAAQALAAEYNKQADNLNRLENQLEQARKELERMKEEQRIAESGWGRMSKVFESAGGGLQRFGDQMREIGKGLTKSITAPVLGVTAAVGGMVASFGWGRLKGIDEARAQLQGMGYDAKEVKQISKEVSQAIQGGMMTMAEGTSVAAGALAAGVKQGKELERYIKLVDAAAVGANSSVSEMALIFNRVQGSGRMMTQELNMIEERMPGFSQTFADHLGVSLEEFRKMVTEGKVTSDDFLDVMEQFAGGMADAYAGTWSGMVQNTKANIGILGENLLSGVFEQSKESIAEFLELLRSKEVRTWASEMGEYIGEAFSNVVNWIKDAVNWFKELEPWQQKAIGLFAGLFVALGPLLMIGGSFLSMIGKIMTNLAPLLERIAKAGGLGKFLGGIIKTLASRFSFLLGPVGIAIGIITTLATIFTVAYKRSETFRNFVHSLGEKIREVFGKLLEWVTPGFEAVRNFFIDIGKRITKFRNEEGAQLMEAFQNIGSIISIVASGIWTVVSWVFEKIKWIIADYVMPIVEFVIKQIWGNIKGIILGALDVIMGAVKIFSGLFTGDFSKMWEGVKQLFFGAIQVVWNWIQLQFIGRILKGVGGLAKGFWDHIKNMWQWVKNTFTNSISTVYNGVKNSFVGRIITSIINFVKNFRTNISNMWTSVKGIFSKWIENIRSSIANSFVGRIIKSITTMKSRFISIAKDMWSGVKKQFDKIVDGAKALPGRIGKGIRNAKDKATDGMKSVGNSIIRWAGKPFNKVVDGVNWITGKLGIKTKVPRWDYPQYAKGTRGKGHPGGIAMIGEEGRELVKLPDGRTFVSPDSHTLLNLPRGTHVIPNRITEKLLNADVPHYAKGTKGWLSSLKDSIKDVWDYISNPSKLVDKVIDKISVKKNLAQIPQKMVNAGWGYVKTKPYDYIKSMFAKAEKEGLGGVGKPAFGWPITSHFGYRIHPITGQRKLHGGVDFGAPMGAPVPSTTAGTVSFAGYGWNGGFGNLVKVRQGIWEMFYAHLSRIFVKAGQSVKKGDILGLVGSTGASTGPHLHYETRRNGVRVNPMSLKGFMTGGIVKSRMMAMLGEDGEEVVIPLAKNRRTDAMKLLALAAKKIGVDDGSFVRPSNLSNDIRTDNKTDELIALLMEQNEYLRKSNELLTALLGKDLDLYKLNKKVDEGLDNLAERRRAAFGG